MKNFWGNYVNRRYFLVYLMAGMWPIFMSWPSIKLAEIQIDMYLMNVKYGFQTHIAQTILSLSMNFIVVAAAIVALILIIASLIRTPRKTTTSN